MTAFWFVLAAALGTGARYAAGLWAAPRRLPGTLTVNVAGSLLLGVLVGLGDRVAPGTRLVLGAGFCGSLTTWSAFAHDVVTAPARRDAARTVLAHVGGGLAAAVLGLALGAALR